MSSMILEEQSKALRGTNKTSIGYCIQWNAVVIWLVGIPLYMVGLAIAPASAEVWVHWTYIAFSTLGSVLSGAWLIYQASRQKQAGCDDSHVVIQLPSN